MKGAKLSKAWTLKWPAPAKLNLMLRIVGQRSDGYHLLQTVFQFIDWCDWIRFYPHDSEQIKILTPTPGVLEQDDLIYKAASLLQQQMHDRQGVLIEVEKNLPMGGGLGGGSSDAATTLVVLNELWGANLTLTELMDLGLKLGADVPVFINGFSAWAEGVGERLEVVSLVESWMVVIRPPCHVNTKEIFLSKELTRNSKQITIGDFLEGKQNNDCEPVVRMRYPQVDEAMSELSVYGDAKLTGTGACVFAEFRSEEQAVDAVEALNGKWQVNKAKSLNRSPLHLQLAMLQKE